MDSTSMETQRRSKREREGQRDKRERERERGSGGSCLILKQLCNVYFLTGAKVKIRARICV